MTALAEGVSISRGWYQVPLSFMPSWQTPRSDALAFPVIPFRIACLAGCNAESTCYS